MDYPVSDWRGHRNTHCPFCSFATTSDNAIEQLDAHVSRVHPTQLREALAAEMTVQIDELRKAMNKGQLLELATAEPLSITGLSMKNTRDEIEAAIAARETEIAAAELAAPTEPAAAAATAPEEE